MTATASQLTERLLERERYATEAIAEIAPTHETWGLAIAERRKAYAIAFMQYRANTEKKYSVADATTLAEADTADLKAAEVAAEGIAKATLEAARLARDMVSSGQTIAGAYKQEWELARTGPGI